VDKLSFVILKKDTYSGTKSALIFAVNEQKDVKTDTENDTQCARVYRDRKKDNYYNNTWLSIPLITQVSKLFLKVPLYGQLPTTSIIPPKKK